MGREADGQVGAGLTGPAGAAAAAAGTGRGRGRTGSRAGGVTGGRRSDFVAGSGSATSGAATFREARAPPSRFMNRSAKTTAAKAPAITTAIAHAFRCSTAAIVATRIRNPAWSRNRGRLRESTVLF